MKNTHVEYSSEERTPTVLPEFAELLPPLTVEQLDALEKDIVANGCYAPVIVNEDMAVIDGHNRKNICEKHGIPYRMAVFLLRTRWKRKSGCWKRSGAVAASEAGNWGKSPSSSDRKSRQEQRQTKAPTTATSLKPDFGQRCQKSSLPCSRARSWQIRSASEKSPWVRS